MLVRYQNPTRVNTSMPTSAAAENHATDDCPRTSTTRLASNGPIALPALPPTWNTDCAMPYRPPDAARATRDDSGWNTAEPSPTSAADTRISW